MQYEALRTYGHLQMPIGHPIGYNFEEEVPGWDGKSYTPVDAGDGDVLPRISQRPYVGFLGVEAKREARTGLFLDPSYYGPAATVGGNPSNGGGGTADTAGGASTHADNLPNLVANPSSTDALVRSEDEVVRDWLRRVGLPDNNTTGNATEVSRSHTNNH